MGAKAYGKQGVVHLLIATATGWTYSVVHDFTTVHITILFCSVTRHENASISLRYPSPTFLCCRECAHEHALYCETIDSLEAQSSADSSRTTCSLIEGLA